MIFKITFSLPTTRIFATLLLLASLFTLSCDDNEKTPVYTGTFNSQGGTEVAFLPKPYLAALYYLLGYISLDLLFIDPNL